ncbi:hypothetical protein [Salinicola halimionae]|uniref:hypothetical protein n=1 Tax=Salinicola halimionae TaxID=1949081 RepID=UPI000DA10FA8|nr:hypothetical protein [Salinicola halimionae]
MAESTADAKRASKKAPEAAIPRLSRQLDAAAAKPKLRHFGADRFEPAWLSLWTLAIGREAEEPLAWLLAADNLPRALLLPGELSLRPAENDDALVLGGGRQPTLAQFERWWLWERLARPRRWPLRLQPVTLRAVEFPLWLGYSQGRLSYRQGRKTQLIVLSGLSGEALGALKPAVLAGLRDRANARTSAIRPATKGQNTASG